MTDAITSRLQASRIELLDLTLRNPLLNYRGSTRRGLDIIDEKSAQIFSVLVVERGPLRFHHTRTAPSKGERTETAVFFVDEASASTVQVGLGEANPENSLATPYLKEGLAERLLATSSDARLTLEEQGANTLFLTLGALRWRDSNEPELDRLAPLVLIPVRLERKSARSYWQVVATDEEAGVNLSLVEKLKEVGIALSPDPGLETVLDLEAFFGAVERAIADKAGWAVDRDRVILGFFSFGKFLMYRDLDPGQWPAESSPSRHEVLSGLLAEGFRDPGDVAATTTGMDEARTPGKTMEVMDADGSQAEALAAVAAGRHLVIQGPPGTGKSQTISNLIAEAVFAGKSVLFVAEKMAALEVVHRRLENIGLGELCLELHSHKTSKKEIAAGLAHMLTLGKPLDPEGAEHLEALPHHRETLNRYVKSVAAPVGSTGTTPFEAVGALERLRTLPEPLPAITCPAMMEWTRASYGEALAGIQDLASKIADLGVPSRHPWDGCGLVQLPSGASERIARAIEEAGAASRAAGEAAQEWGTVFRVDPPSGPEGLEAWCRVAALSLEAPDLRGMPPIGMLWENPDLTQSLAVASKAGRELKELREAWETRLAPHAWESEVATVRADLMSDGYSFFSRLFSGRFRAAKQRVATWCTPPPPRKTDDLVAVTDAILKSRQVQGEIEKRQESSRALLGSQWKGPESDWVRVMALRDWGMKFRALLSGRKLPEGLAEWVVGPWDRESLRGLLGRGEQALDRYRKTWMTVATLLAWVVEGRGELERRAFSRGAQQADLWRRELERLPGYVAYWKLREDLVHRGLREIAAAAHGGIPSAPRLPALLEKAWAERVLDQAFRERPELRDFDAVLHEQVIQRFRAADAATFGVNRVRLAERHWQSLPGKIGYGQVGLLRHECAKKARLLPIRRLMDQAGHALQAMKPVFLMSPLSIASYLPPGGPVFDLVVFDEASQVKPVDAFGAILRGRQVVVVGDEKQMPPTSFFDTMLAEGKVREEEEAGKNVTQDLPSILGLCTSRGMPSRMLRWHYRSRHDSLIAVSNAEFYDNQLIVFPSPDRRRENEGLLIRSLPNTVYERGSSRTNPLEAEAIVEAVLEHSRTTPQLSLGVVAFSQPQREAIELRIEQLRRRNPDFDAFISTAREEPVFVKNLENVQGDERDVILISIGYGRDGAGAVSMNFGPLNQGGGERRLNVLITRARRKCLVFTNLTADDIDLKRATGQGMRVLKSFLAFAEKGILETAPGPSPAPVPDLPTQVSAVLRKKGFETQTEVGSGGYRIELAVTDPSAKGRYLLGIEFDGNAYAGARWARDRDRLRNAVLQGLGWRIHRVWSADWRRNREEAIRRLENALEEARTERHAGIEPAREPRVRRAKESPPAGPPPPPAYTVARPRARLAEDTHLAEVDPAALAGLVAEIVERESPVHKGELHRRILEAIDERPGAKKAAAIEEAVVRAVTRGLVRSKGDFLWSKEDRPVVPRDRSSLPEASRAVDGVSDEECRSALRRVIDEACGCQAEEAAVQAVKILGIKRNDDALTRLGGLLGGMVAEGTLRRSSSGLVSA